MTKREKLIVTAYTGVLMVDFIEFQKFASEILGRPLFSHEFAQKSVTEEIERAVKPDFLNLCAEGEDDYISLSAEKVIHNER